MITGSPYITNFSSRIVVHAELTHTTYGTAPVHIKVTYDSSAINGVKLVCTPALCFGRTGSLGSGQYRPMAGKWGIIEKKATAGDIVDVVIQGLETYPNTKGSGQVGNLIDGLRPNYHMGSANGFRDDGFCYLEAEPVDGGTDEYNAIANNLGVVVNYGADGQILIWQGVNTPYLSDYSHGEAHRVQAKLQGTYSGGDGASITAGSPVMLYLDTNGDLLARGGHASGGGTQPGYIQQTNFDARDTLPGYWGIAETGGASGDVVDIVVAGHCQTADTSTVADQQISQIQPDGEIWSFGKNIISDSADRTFDSNTGNWVGYASTGSAAAVDVDSAITNKMEITTNTTSSIQGAQLPASDLETLVVGKTYVVGAQIQLMTTSDTPTMVFSLGGALSGTFTISTSNLYYAKEITIANNTDPLIIAQVNSTTAYEISVNNLYVFEKDAGILGDDAEADDWVPLSRGVTVNDTGKICIFPGVNRYDIRNYKEQQIVTAKVIGPAVDTANKYAVSLCVDKDGKLRAILDNIPTSYTGGSSQFSIPSNKWGIALEAGSSGDDIKVLVSGKMTEMDTTSDATWVAGDILKKLGSAGKKERNTGFEYEAITLENDRTLASASNWAEHSLNTTLATFTQDTGNNRIQIKGSGNGTYTNDSGGSGREGAKLINTHLREMNDDDTSFNTGTLEVMRMYLVQADLWHAGSGTLPMIGATCGGETKAEGHTYPFVFEDGTGTISTTQRTARAWCNAAYISADSGTYENLCIVQTNDSELDWYFTNVSVTYLPHTGQADLGICLNADKKEWYIY